MGGPTVTAGGRREVEGWWMRASLPPLLRAPRGQGLSEGTTCARWVVGRAEVEGGAPAYVHDQGQGQRQERSESVQRHLQSLRPMGPSIGDLQ
eukprot:2305023-Heterocapsa_arctica.AAC.1